jgi:hypothetical protein
MIFLAVSYIIMMEKEFNLMINRSQLCLMLLTNIDRNSNTKLSWSKNNLNCSLEFHAHCFEKRLTLCMFL